jgi:hypothetical protein
MRPHRQNERFAATESLLAPAPRRRGPSVTFSTSRCTGWRYVAEELSAAGVTAHVAEPAGTAAARGRKRHAKTGETDSAHLRQLLAEGWLPERWVRQGCRILAGPGDDALSVA